MDTFVALQAADGDDITHLPYHPTVQDMDGRTHGRSSVACINSDLLVLYSCTAVYIYGLYGSIL